MSMFGGKKKEKEASSSPTLRQSPSNILGTGGKIDEMTLSLIEAANDQDSKVRSAITKSLQEIGKKQPDLLLSSCNEFIQRNPKLSREHRVILLNVVYQVLELKRQSVSPNLIMSLIKTAMAELTMQKEVIPDWQAAASSVLVSLGMRFPNDVLEELLQRFSPGTVPHYFIMKTLGDMILANAVETVPRLREVIARVLPVLASVKHDNMKWVFAAGLGHFCDAIVAHVANAKNPDITVHSFSSDIFPAYEILFTNWLNAKEPKVRLASIQALGSMCAVLSPEQLEIQIPKLVGSLLSFYKKEKDLLPITQGFNTVLDVAVKDGNRVLEPLLPNIFAIIHPLSCAIPDYSNSYAIKNYNELLRCWQTIATVFSDNVITFLLERFATKDARVKIGTIAILRHLTTHNVENLEDKKGLIVSGLKPLVMTETSWTIKKELAQTIIAMASHDYLSLEGGETLLEFIVRCAGISEEEIKKYESDKKKESTSPMELRNLCDNILNLATTTIDPMEQVLWPYLFEVLIPAQYSEALGIVCKCLAHIASKKREADDEKYIIDFDRAVNLPKPQAIIARLLIMVNAVDKRNQLSLNILNCLQAIGPVLHPSICDMWDSAIPKLVSYLEKNMSTDSWSSSVWEDLILRLLSETIKNVNDDEWTMVLSDQIAQQFPLYDDDPDVKRVALKHMGLVLQKSTHKVSINSKLELMLSVVDHTNDKERIGCAQGFGYCSNTHLDMTLEKVHTPKTVAKPKKAKSGLFSFMSKEKSDDTSKMTNTLVLCYGYITAFASPSLITSRIDISIMNHLKPIMAKVKSQTTKDCLITTFELMAKAMHPSHLKKEYIFKHRDDLVKQILEMISQGEVKDNLRVSALSAFSALINLDPILPSELEKELLDKITSFYGLPRTEETNNIIEKLNQVFGTILFCQPTIACLVRLLKVISPFLCSTQGEQREKSSETAIFLLKKMVELKTKEPPARREKSFSGVGGCIAIFLPRCADRSLEIRETCIESIQICLFLNYLLKQQSEETLSLPSELLPFKDFKQRLNTDELNEQFAVIHEMSRLLSSQVNEEELPELLLEAIRGLNDPVLECTSGTCVVLNALIKSRGEELQARVPQLVSGLLHALESITNEQTMNGTLHTLRSLATHHELAVIDELLNSALPHSTHVKKALQAIAKDENLVMPFINHLFQIVNYTQPYEQKFSNDAKASKPVLVACHLPMSATAAIGELLELDEVEDIIADNFSLFFSSLALRIGTSNGMSDAMASDIAVNTLRQLINCGKESLMEAALDKNDNWSKLKGPNFDDAIADVAGAVCTSHPEEMKPIFEFLLKFLRGNFPGQRVVTITIYAEFVKHCKTDDALLQQLINYLLSSLADPIIKLQSIRGLSNIVHLKSEQSNQYAPTVLDALMSSIDDPNENIAKEAMNGLSQVFAIVDENRVTPVLVNICTRIRPAFDKLNDEIRASSFNLFGSLYRFGGGSASDIFYEQLHNNLTSLVVHTNDDNEEVRKACKTALRSLSHLFRSEEVDEVFTSNSFDPNGSLDYQEFLNDLAKAVSTSYPEKMNTFVMTSVEYFRSEWSTIRANAASFVGYLLGNFPLEQRKSTYMNPGLVSSALISLLKDKSPDVRRASSLAMSLLHEY